MHSASPGKYFRQLVLPFLFSPALAPLLLLSGCAGVQVHLGLKIHIDKTPIVSLAANLADGPAIAPGERSPLVVTLTEPNGTLLVSEGKGGGKVLWADLAVTATVVSVSKKGVVSLPRDPRLSDGKIGHLAVTVPSHPGLLAQLDIPLRYDYKYSADFSGSNGSSGFNGANGLDGQSGSIGSFDPNNPAPGGNGTNGSNGSDGQDGSTGANAPPVQLRVAVRAGAHPLLELAVIAPGYKQQLFLVDPQGGSLTVTANGGRGGAGGKGGRAGRGGAGGTGTPNGQNGSDGLPGHDGSDGRDGNGGSITVTYDPQAKPYLSTIHLLNQGGPAPVFKQEPVPLLW